MTDLEQQLDASPPVRRLAFETQALQAGRPGSSPLCARCWRRARTGRSSSTSRASPKASDVSWPWPPPSRSAKVPARAPRLPGSPALGPRARRWAGRPRPAGLPGAGIFACGRLVTGQARFRRADLALFVQETGCQALGIVTLINFLIGLILAFMGAIQLRQFGAEIYVADLVGLGMTREMGAVMTGIIMAGRTGAAYAAQLGTMQVNEEIDALSTMGIPAMEFWCCRACWR